MTEQVGFTKRKFLGFPLARQHKKCAELLKERTDLSHYNEIQGWMGNSCLNVSDPQDISDRFHWHLKLANQSVSEHHLLSKVRTNDRTEPKGAPLPIAIYLDNIRSAHNVGSILRTVEAFSLGEVYFSRDTPFVDHQQVQKTSMGSYEYVTCFQNAKLSELPRPIIAMETMEGAIPINDFTFPSTFSLVVGNEEYGCSKETLEHADSVVEIPLRGRKNSLNVANAFAIAAALILEGLSWK